MGTQGAIVVLAASVALLAGCTPALALPKPMSQADADRVVENQRDFLWNSKFPHEPMPVIAPLEYQERATPTNLADECSAAAGMLDVVLTGGSWAPVVAPGFDEDAVSRAFFACLLKYPLDTSDPSGVGLLTDDERAWIRSYNQMRLVPCLQLMGYDVDNREGGYIRGNGPEWNPYTEMLPAPTSAAEWERIDRRCPPSPIGPVVR